MCLGGGAGFQGGNAGHKSHAEGGTSAFLIKNAQFEWSKGVNRGNGQILIVRCALKCPTNSTCAFEKPVPGIEAEQFCQCMNGKQTTSNGSCSLSGISCESFFVYLQKHQKTSIHNNNQ